MYLCEGRSIKQFIAVSSSIDQTDGALKRALFLFDRLALVNLNHSRLELRRAPHLRADLDWLVAQGYAFDLKNPVEEWREHYRGVFAPGFDSIGRMQSEVVAFLDYLRKKRTALRWNSRLDARLRDQKLEALDVVESRLLARIHSIDLASRHDTDAVILQSDTYPLDGRSFDTIRVAAEQIEGMPAEFRHIRDLMLDTREEQTMTITLHAFPVPGDTTPLYEVTAFRRETEMQAHFMALKVWMNRTAAGELTPQQIEDELQHLMNEFESQIARARLSVGRTVVTTLAISSAAFAEELVRFRFSKALERLGAFRARKLALLGAEAAAPGRELAYIVKARQRFGRWW